MNVNVWNRQLYRLAYRYNAWLRRNSWGGSVALGVLLALGVGTRSRPAHVWWMVPAMGGLSVWLVAVAMLWLVFPAWYSVRFRDVAWWWSSSCGSVRRWLTTGWRLAVLLPAGVAVVLWVRSVALGSPHRVVDFLAPVLAFKVVVLTLLLVLAERAYQARRRIVIAAFTDHTGDAAMKPQVEGLATRLLAEIARLTDLFRVIDEARPEAGKGGPVEATVGVGDFGQAVQGAIQADAKVNLGVVQFSLGGLLGLLGQVVQGPRLTGSLHKNGDTLILLAAIQGGGLRGNWRVGRDDLAEPGAGATVDRLIQQLALRIVTDLADVGSPRWQAVQHYTEGLRLYRETLRLTKDRILNLSRAEAMFVRALAEDPKFAQNHYNLAILYRDLKKPDSARAAFWQAVREGTALSIRGHAGLTRAYYALALSYYDSDDFGESARLCDHAIRLRADDPLAWDLRGLSEHHAGRPGRGLESLEIGAALAWRDLCRSVRTGQADAPGQAERTEAKLRDIARNALRNLAVAVAAADRRRSLALFAQATRLAPATADLFFEQGKVHHDAGDWKGARIAFENALRIEPSPLSWAYLADATAHRIASATDPDTRTRYKAEAIAACRRALDFASGAVGGDVWRLADQAWTRIVDGTDPAAPDWHAIAREAEEVRLMPAVMGQLDRQAGEDKAAHGARLDALLQEHAGRDWLHAQAAIRLADWHKDRARSATGRADKPVVYAAHAAAEALLVGAIRRLEARHPMEIEERDLHGRLVEIHLDQHKLGDALFHAERAVALRPEESRARAYLGEVYFALADYERAEAELQMSLDLKPDHQTLVRIAEIDLTRGDALHRAQDRRQVLARAIQIFGQAVALMECLPLESDPNKVADQVRDRSRAHLALGKLHREQLEFDKAIAHLKIAAAYLDRADAPDPARPRNREQLLETRVRLGMAFLRAKSHEEAVQAFRTALSEVRRSLRAEGGGNGVPGVPARSLVRNMVFALNFWALSHALRAQNDRLATRLVKTARKHITRVGPARMDVVTSQCNLVEGMIHLNAGRIDQAIAQLERSVARIADAESYYFLARACHARAETKINGRAEWLARARKACDLADETDWRNEHKAEIDALRRALDAAPR